MDFNPPLADFIVVCSKGTYVRTLAHDLGQKLGCGAFLFQLERTKIGEFKLEDAIDLEQLKILIQNRLN